MTSSKENASSLIYRTQTWRGQIIEIEDESEQLIINFRYLPWLIELLVWNAPFIIIFGIVSVFYSMSNTIGLPVLYIFFGIYIGFLLSQILRERPFEISIWRRFLLILYSKIGLKKTIIKIIKNNDQELEHKSEDNKIVFQNDIKGLGYIQSDFLKLGMNFQAVQLVLIMQNNEIIPIGGWYGVFLLVFKNQRTNFWNLYVKIADLLKIPRRKERTVKLSKVIYKGNNYPIGSNWFLFGYIYREKLYKKKKPDFRFKSKSSYVSIWVLTIWMVNFFAFFVLIYIGESIFQIAYNFLPDSVLSTIFFSDLIFVLYLNLFIIFLGGAVFRFLYDILLLFRGEWKKTRLDY